MIINLEAGLETLLAQNEAQKKSLVRDACMSILKLSEIALKPDSASILQYLDFLIPQVEEAGTAEWVQKLKDLQRAAASQESTNSAVGCLGRKGNAPPKELTDSAEGYTCWMNRDMQNALPKESTDSAEGCLGRKGNSPPKELTDFAEGYTCWRNRDTQNALPKESTDSAVGCLGRKGKDMQNAPPKELTDSAEGYTCWRNRDTQNAPPKESTDSAEGCLGRKGNAPPKELTDSAEGCVGRKGKDMQNAPPKESTNSAEGCLGRKGNAPHKELTDSAEGCVGRKGKDMQNAPPKESTNSAEGCLGRKGNAPPKELTDSAEGCVGRKGKDMRSAPPKESTGSAVGDAVEYRNYPLRDSTYQNDQHQDHQYWTHQNHNDQYRIYSSWSTQNQDEHDRCDRTFHQDPRQQYPDRNNNHCLEVAAVPTAAPEHVSRWVADQHQLRSTFPGPLMRNDLDKIELVRFIQWKAVECSCTDQSDHQAGHVFWKMMELFCTRENTVKWTDITDLLLRTCKSLRKQDDWHRRLVSLLSSSRDSDDQQRTAVIAMGDTLASAGLINPAHICYTVALVQLSSFRGPTSLVLVGSDDRHPFSEFATSEALERTEVYEYVLSLFSGFGQPDFQVFKLIRAGHLADAGRFDEATKYCESITRAVSSFPSSSSITRTLLSRLIEVRKLIHTYEDPQLSERVIRDRRTEPEWLIDLRQLKQSKEAAVVVKASTEAEEQDTVVSQLHKLECGLMEAGRSTPHTAPLLQCEVQVIDETAGEHLHLLPPQTDSSVEPLTEFKVTVEEPEEEAEEREEEELAVCSNHLECETGQPEYDLMSTVTSQNPPLTHQTVQQHVCSTVVQQQQQHFPSDLSTKEVSDTIPFLFS
ncbi:hypothetical protein NFI96_006771 [Prochilodus magdalenae]|nr:hypothetical protein NFI96_006771 [Prochilodus magdalenae]